MRSPRHFLSCLILTVLDILTGVVQSTPTNNNNSRSYAEDVTSVTSGASQGPHSFNLVFVCLCVCLFVCLFVSRLAPSVSDGKKA